MLVAGLFVVVPGRYDKTGGQALVTRAKANDHLAAAEVGRCSRRRTVAPLVLLAASAMTCSVFLCPTPASAQLPSPPVQQRPQDPAPPTRPPGAEESPEAPEKVEVQPQAADPEIRQRLQGILEVTGWFAEPQVQVREGVVFLKGQAETAEHKKWAGDLARNTEGVAAVVNQIEVVEPSIWDFGPSLRSLQELWRSIVWALPFVMLSLLILVLTGVIAMLTARLARRVLYRRLASQLLRNVVAKTVGLAVLIIGLYVIFRVAGLTGVAFTVVGGTGLLGLILGIAFREITENFLASIFLSAQQPFRTGDMIQINEHLGFVQRLTTRATIIMTLDGNHLQIPNIVVYRSPIRNYTSNCNRREDFLVGIGYSDHISFAQEVALRVLKEHPAVLNDPEPWVLVDSLGTSTVVLRVFFWMNGHQHSWLKVRSSVIRLIKRAFQAEGISMPDEARELVFPEGVPVHLLQGGETGPAQHATERDKQSSRQETDSVTTDSEGGLHSEAGEIEAQARKSRTPEEGRNLLDDPSTTR